MKTLQGEKEVLEVLDYISFILNIWGDMMSGISYKTVIKNKRLFDFVDEGVEKSEKKNEVC